MPRGPEHRHVPQPRTPSHFPSQQQQRYSHDRSDTNNSRSSSGSKSSNKYTGQRIPKGLQQRETDPVRLAHRQRQIDFGKNTIGYENYIKQVPKEKRTRKDPWTPDKYQICSKRSWDGQIRKWRRQLHHYDPPAAEDEVVINLSEEDEEVDIEGDGEVISTSKQSKEKVSPSSSSSKAAQDIYAPYESDEEVDITH